MRVQRSSGRATKLQGSTDRHTHVCLDQTTSGLLDSLQLLVMCDGAESITGVECERATMTSSDQRDSCVDTRPTQTKKCRTHRRTATVEPGVCASVR